LKIAQHPTMSDIVILGSPEVIEAWTHRSEATDMYISEFDAMARVAAPHRIHVVAWRDTAQLRSLVRTSPHCVLAPLAVWDYVRHFDEIFRAVFDDAELGARCCTPPRVLRWNGSKHYLLELQERGIPVVPSAFVDDADPATIIARGFSELFPAASRLVFKPAIGAGAFKQVLVSRAQFDTAGHVAALVQRGEAPAGGVVVQPFLESVAAMGEISLLFVAHKFVLAVRKVPGANDYRVQLNYGSTVVRYEPSEAELALGERVLATTSEMNGGVVLPYARVDFMFASDGAPLLGEIELFEPMLYLAWSGDAAGEETAKLRSAKQVVEALAAAALVKI
jgi:hypothetical protein